MLFQPETSHSGPVLEPFLNEQSKIAQIMQPAFKCPYYSKSHLTVQSSIHLNPDFG